MTQVSPEAGRDFNITLEKRDSRGFLFLSYFTFSWISFFFTNMLQKDKNPISQVRLL